MHEAYIEETTLTAPEILSHKISHIMTSKHSAPAILLLAFSSFFVYSAQAQAELDLSDVGIVSLENNGAPEAQQAFLHGLAQLHNFEYNHAREDFKEAQSIDPAFALAYWGEAMTHNHPIWMQQDREAALNALNKYAPTPAARQEKAPTELTRDLFIAVDILFGDGEKHDRDDRYRDAMARLHKKYPDNVEVAAFYALSIMGTAHEGREFALYMQSAALMQKFFVHYPNHPGVAHYLIHATDDPIHAPLGLDAAMAYSKIAPNAGHAQHMTSHIFLALGDWERTIKANVRASDIQNKARAANGQNAIGCAHYPSWLMYGYLQVGERDKAHQIMKRCHDNMVNGDLNNSQSPTYYSWQRALYLFDTGEWEGAIASTHAPVGDNTRAQLELVVIDGFAALAKGDMRAAKVALKTSKEHLKAVHQYWDEEGVPQDYEQRLTRVIQVKQLEAQIMFNEGQTDKAITAMRDIAAEEAALSFGFGPPSPPKPSYEMLGEMLLSVGNYEEARMALKTALSRTPNKAMSLRALQSVEAELAIR